MKQLFVGLALCLAAVSAKAAVILQYHHVADDTPRSTSLTVEAFEQQMQYLKDRNFQVIALSELVAAIQQGKALAENTVVITFDDGYQNNFDNARPILRQHGFPYTVFVAAEPIHQKQRPMMSWQTLKQMADEGAEIANHSWSHNHLVHRRTDETHSQWLARIQGDLQKAERDIEKYTGQSWKTLAYPFGEFDADLKNLLKQMGYVGIGQHSGAVGLTSDLQALPRFPMADAFADMDSFKLKVSSRAFEIESVTPENPVLAHEDSRPVLTVTLNTKDINKNGLMCFVQGQGAKAPTWVSDNQFTVKADQPLSIGRSRYNCTAPSLSSKGYYWFSQPWLRAKADGSFPKG
ncbi:polysaccharide deacetylase family protein [Paraferrimonas sedimenticola]|uniref:Polysaccharide deacetylase n=1 Tax=Paraferrimonas sedimenticola TaxID=375674 RepID=A0AA37VUX0_9GAMM|nr:polysaccharide deacetylase family protein [Paraferrimonas sedimenticola]GLP95949.1 polysaccharide deacetylase [Paraferrimonas sedimenticola]